MSAAKDGERRKQIIEHDQPASNNAKYESTSGGVFTREGRVVIY